MSNQEPVAYVALCQLRRIDGDGRTVFSATQSIRPTEDAAIAAAVMVAHRDKPGFGIEETLTMPVTEEAIMPRPSAPDTMLRDRLMALVEAAFLEGLGVGASYGDGVSADLDGDWESSDARAALADIAAASGRDRAGSECKEQK